MKYVKIPVILLLLALMSCEVKDDNGNDTDDCLTGSGATIIETPSVSGFHSIAVGIEGDLNITQGSPHYVSIETHPNVMDELQVEVDNGVLKIGFDRCTSNIEKLVIDVTMPDINSIIFSGVGELTGMNDFNLDELTVILSGVGDINLSGEADEFTCIISGIGNLRAFDLVTSECTLTISGIGDAQVTATDILNVFIAGNGNVYYKGSPSITHNISGAGSIIDSN
jgi:hypothetical protein